MICRKLLKQDSSGFTVVEVAIALAIVSIMAAIVMSSLVSWRPNFQLKGAARDVYSSMMRAKSEAIKRNVNVNAQFQDAAGVPSLNPVRFQLIEAGGGGVLSTTGFEQGIVVVVTANPLGFTPRGIAAAAGSVTLSHPDTTRTYTLTVGASGRVRLI